MSRQPLFLIVAICAATAIGFPREASADMAPWAEIGQLIQEEQDVKIQVAAYGTSLDGRELSLERVQGDKSVLLGSGPIFSDENMVSSSFWCDNYFLYTESIAADEFCTTYPSVCLSCPEHEGEICIGSACSDCTLVEDNTIYPENVPYEGDFCDAYPTYMVDCDNDDQPDCCLGCDITYEYHYEFVDECVPPGTTKYILDGSLVDEYGGSESEIDVVDAETACEPASTDDFDSDTADTEPDTESDEEQETDPEPDSETEIESDEEQETDPAPDSETEIESDEEQESDTETLESTDDEDSDSTLGVDTEEPFSTDSNGDTDDGDSETKEPPGDTDEPPSGTAKSTSGCSVSGTGAVTQSGIRQLLVALF